MRDITLSSDVWQWPNLLLTPKITKYTVQRIMQIMQIKKHTLFLRRMSNLSPSPALRSRITKAPVLRAEDHLTSMSPATFIAGTFLRCTLLHCKGLNKTKQFGELNRVDNGGDVRFWKISLKIHLENLNILKPEKNSRCDHADEGWNVDETKQHSQEFPANTGDQDT